MRSCRFRRKCCSAPNDWQVLMRDLLSICWSSKICPWNNNLRVLHIGACSARTAFTFQLMLLLVAIHAGITGTGILIHGCYDSNCGKDAEDESSPSFDCPSHARAACSQQQYATKAELQDVLARPTILLDLCSRHVQPSRFMQKSRSAARWQLKHCLCTEAPLMYLKNLTSKIQVHVQKSTLNGPLSYLLLVHLSVSVSVPKCKTYAVINQPYLQST